MGRKKDIDKFCDEHMFMLATAYVPYQELGDIYPLGEALMKGTLFPELYRPYQY